MSHSLYRIVGALDWKAGLDSGTVPRCGSDERDGFVHLSTEESFLETADLYFDPTEEPLALEIDPSALGSNLKWEVVEKRGGAAFPHLYAPGIPASSVIAVIRLDHDGARFSRGVRTALETPRSS